MTEATTDIALQAVTTQTDDNFRSDFEIDRSLPEELKPLEQISRNFYWSWQPEGVALFRDLSPGLWQEVEQNPRVLLKKISYIRLWQRASDPAYVERLKRFYTKFEQYVSTSTTDPK